jgi:thiamine-phosphate pyrophosphorylase
MPDMIEISKLHYITTSAALAEKACLGGVNWIQLRLKEINYNDHRTIAREVQAVCKAHGCTFIINDNVELALELRADGVHIGKEDMPPDVARTLLQDDFIIGCTANTLEDIVALSAKPIDYIGLGPYRFTSTKQKLSPILGAEGYVSIFDRIKELALQTPPVVAIGGITEEDIAILCATGLHGIAVSGGISSAAQPTDAAAMFVSACEKHFGPPQLITLNS